MKDLFGCKVLHTGMIPDGLDFLPKSQVDFQ